MVELTGTGAGQGGNDVFEALGHRRRREILRILDRVSRASPAELATHLVAAETGQPLMDVSRPDAEDALVDLLHAHLPRLEDANLVTRTDDRVETTEHPALQDPKIEAMIASDASDWDDVVDCLADERRRVALSTLYRTGAPMDRTDLAVAVAESDQTDTESSISVEDVLVEMHHLHLPKLEAAGLVSYDAEAETVTYEGHPDLDGEWLVAGPDDSPRANLSIAD